MINFLSPKGASERWSRAVTSMLRSQWGLLDAQYGAGLKMMESVLGVPARAGRADNGGPPAPQPVAAPAAPGMRESATQIENKVAVVTGAASGIGEALVRELAERGVAAVVLVDRSDRVEELARSINEAAGRAVAEARVGDTTDDAFRAGVFDEVVARHGVVNICVPAAGVTRDALAVRVDKATGKAAVYPAETFRQVVEVNLLAPVYWALEMVARIAEDRLRRGLGRWDPQEQVQGTVVFIGSVSSQGNKGQISYATTKAGLEGAAATLTKEAMYHGVRCAVIHPGFTDTPMVRALGEEYIRKNILPYTQLRRLIRPKEIAEAICFLIANSAVSGELWADAGWHPSA
jgi:NAD(P)-dependent dehydrogenase (short-subunit alcohol dehydrogenase family)